MKSRRTQGQSLIEFALLIPLVILLFTMLIDIGRTVFLYSTLSNAAREGTRYAIVHPAVTEADRADIENRTKEYVAGLRPEDVVVVVTLPGTDGYVNVETRYCYQPITPGLTAIIGSGNCIDLEARSRALMSPLYRPD